MNQVALKTHNWSTGSTARIEYAAVFDWILEKYQNKIQRKTIISYSSNSNKLNKLMTNIDITCIKFTIKRIRKRLIAITIADNKVYLTISESTIINRRDLLGETTIIDLGNPQLFEKLDEAIKYHNAFWFTKMFKPVPFTKAFITFIGVGPPQFYTTINTNVAINIYGQSD